MNATALDCSIDVETRAQAHKALDKWLDHCVTNPVLQGEGVRTFKLEAYLVVFERRFAPLHDASGELRFRKASGYGTHWKITIERRDRGLLDEADDEANADRSGL